jgi:modification methylase
MLGVLMEVNKIICGDVLEVLKSLDDDIFDLGVTSPPYNKKQAGGGKGQIFGPIVYDSFDDTLPEEEYQNQQVNILNEIYRSTKPGGSFFYNHKIRHTMNKTIHPIEWLTKTEWAIKQEIVWDRTTALNIRGYHFWQSDERIYWLYKLKDDKISNEMKSWHAKLSSVWRFPPDRKNEHPAPFPLVLPLRIILSVLNEEKGLVLDPYMGSGTTAVASKLLGSDYVGIDISENYIKKAQDRIDGFESERSVLDNEKKLHKLTGKTYAERKRLKQKKENEFWESK